MLRIGIAGLGVVGSHVIKLLTDNASSIAERAGQPIKVTAVSARDRSKMRTCDLTGIEWVASPLDLVPRHDVDVVVELIGGAEGTPRLLAEAALKAGKSLVTANKALLAAHGDKLAAFAEQSGSQIVWEASVAGGIPVIKALREGMAANRVSVVHGILNGTCNYILTRMRAAKIDFATALKEAQEKGYAEADPSADIDGHDTANKLALLAAVAFGGKPNLDAIHVAGIRHITPVDLAFAEDLDFRIKLLGNARLTDHGVEQSVGPSLVPLSSPLSQIDGVLNAVLLRGDYIGEVMLSGRGAGGHPTASAVVADLIDLARGRKTPVFGIPTAGLKSHSTIAAPPMRYYIRLQVMDRPGGVADISAILRDEGISIESMLQRGQSAIESVPVVITTHSAAKDGIDRAMTKISRLAAVSEKPCVMTIEE